MSNNLITEARELDAAATKGPWRAAINKSKRKIAVTSETGVICEVWMNEGDTDLIARYRTLVPELADALEKECDTIEALIGLFPICTDCDGKEPEGYLTDKCEKDYCSPKCVKQAVAYGREYMRMKAELTALREAGRQDRPEIVCLCGSTRFTDIMLVKQWELTKQGCIVLSWCALPDWYFAGVEKAHIGDQEGVKELVDEVHKRKIDLCDRIFVLNVDGYIGSSTRSEINYAYAHGKPVEYLEPLPAAPEHTEERESYPCTGYECYERGNYHDGCGECQYFKRPAAPEQKGE